MTSFLRLKRNWTARSLTIVVMLSMVCWANPQAWGLTITENATTDDFGDFPGGVATFPSDPGANTYTGTLTTGTDPTDFIKIQLNGLEILSGFVSYDSGTITPNIDFQLIDYSPVVNVIQTVTLSVGQSSAFSSGVISTWNTNGVAEIAIITSPCNCTAFYTVGITTTPEPATLVTLASGLLLAGGLRWYRRCKSSPLA